PASSHSTWSGVTASPSLTSQVSVTSPPSWRNTSSAQARPHITALSRLIMRASARVSAPISCAVISPLPTSSSRAVRTWFGISASTYSGSSIFFTGKEFSGQSEDDRAQHQQGNQVGNSHHGVHYVGHTPHQFQVDRSAHRDQYHPDDAERQYRPFAKQVLGTALAIKAPAEQGGEGKNGQADHHDRFAEAAVGGAERHRRQRRAIFAALPCACHHDGEAGNGTDDDGVNKSAEHADGALAHRVVGDGRGVGNWRAAKAGLIGKDAASNTVTNRHGDGGAGKAAGGRGPGKGIGQA